jgi:Flp pilus assembly protein TadD/ADP-heptose:LPS heptosyltransferase
MLGDALRHHQAGRRADAERIYRRILEMDSHHADSLHLLGLIAFQNGCLEDAVGLMSRAIAIRPQAAHYHSNLGNALQSQGKLDEAIECYRRALLLAPGASEVHINLGNVLQAKGLLDEAVACFECSLALKADNPEAYSNLGNALQEQDRLQDAAACYEKALALKPNYAAAHYNLGSVFLARGDLDGALAQYRRALELQPDYDRAGFAEALAQLMNGEFAAGWPKFERRWKTDDHDTPRRSYPQPLWMGDKLSAGPLFIWGEQGVGDEIMFAGLLPYVLRTRNICILECDARLQPLFARSFPEIDVISRDTCVSPAEFAAHLPSGSLPGLFRTSDASFAATSSPYLFADLAQREKLRTRYFDGRRIVGLAWHTRNKKTGLSRSIDLSMFAPLFSHPDICWVSLQYGDLDELCAQAESASTPILIDREVDQLSDLDLFAAQVAAMDMVITIDNSTAHLAGALGIPVWVLLPFVADWRWRVGRDDSPWYPSMRLFRQTQTHDWQSVINRIHDAL